MYSAALPYAFAIEIRAFVLGMGGWERRREVARKLSHIWPASISEMFRSIWC